ncbi:hypothetical protein MIND_01136800 [Mycena indigotica]|uniref:Transcription factor domain-containing protein n=1 Tax=Mycena indigotica TaxID=2126181 RepID=A0A8H6S7F8_9AGAR|nr:uncharacterized protein MIND_01136800 [Mycena indigotica]KAF7293580.1 hypothetical protein MIND_01136800 [Mycena indigotica]
MYPPLEFPDPDLLETLVHIYFEQINPIMGVLHRISFEGSLESNRHLTERAFGEVVLGVCAVASKYSDDPRVFLDEAPRDSEHSGLEVLGVFYFCASSTPDECWFHVGVGLRFLQAVGGQHEAWYHKTNLEPVDVELYKCAFWTLVLWETLMSTFKGQVSTIRTSAVNEWIDGIPAHCQILIHRPFVAGPGKQSSVNTSFPSMAICANAARSIGHVLKVGSLPVYTSFAKGSDKDSFPFMDMHRHMVAPALYQPPSHLDAQFDKVPGMLPPELVYMAEAALNEPLVPEPSWLVLPPDTSAFDVPMNP